MLQDVRKTLAAKHEVTQALLMERASAIKADIS
jgi:hypothetical protein